MSYLSTEELINCRDQIHAQQHQCLKEIYALWFTNTFNKAPDMDAGDLLFVDDLTVEQREWVLGFILIWNGIGLEGCA